LTKRRFRRCASIQNLPADFERIISKALEKDRNLRYQSAADLRTDLARLKRDLDSDGLRAQRQHRGRKFFGSAAAQAISRRIVGASS